MLARVPVVLGTEVNIYANKRRWHALAERLLMKKTDAVIASAESVRNFYVGQVHADPNRVEVIYNAVDWAHAGDAPCRARRCVRASACPSRHRSRRSSRG